MKKIITIIIVLIVIALISNKQTNNIDKKIYIDEIKKTNKVENIPIILYVGSLKIKLKQIINVSLSGSLALEDNKFRLVASSILGKEIDIGINDNEIWYWSKRSKPHGLFYSKLENMNKTNLKSALNPNWLIKAIGLSITKNEKSEIFKIGNNTIILNKDTNHLNEDNSVVTIIENKSNKILGNYLYNNVGRLIASSEIKEHCLVEGLILPKKISIVWYDEGISMEWTFNHMIINKKINNNVWNKPNIYPIIDIGK